MAGLSYLWLLVAFGWSVEGSPPRKTNNALQSRATGFRLISSKQLEGSPLNENCRHVLEQTINCDEYVANFGERAYRGSLGDLALTDSICQATCERALTTARRRIAGLCASTPNLVPGYPVALLIETVIAGWNETCLKDKKTGKYCNDLIDSWDDYDDVDKMPDTELCSFCFGAKLRMMQQSPYSAYDELFARTHEAVNKRCDMNGPTAALPDPINLNITEPDPCFSKQTYVTRDGDTCDSIAIAKSVSAATLYYLNPNLLNCSSISAGQQLCLPERCQTLYQVKDKYEDCVIIGVNAGTTWTKLVNWNLALNEDCTNIFSTSPFWGRVICVSPPGGEYSYNGPPSGGNVGNGDIGGQGGSGDGFSDDVVDAPRGTVAKGTTALCGRYIQAEPGVVCPSLISKLAVPMDLFLKANPSLGTVAECDGKLVPGVWYCLNPHHDFEAGKQ